MYTACNAGDDLLMLGRIFSQSRNGKTTENDFCARMVVDNPISDFPRVKFFRLSDLNCKLSLFILENLEWIFNFLLLIHFLSTGLIPL